MSASSTPAAPAAGKRKVAVSLDVEADGPAPSMNSCLMIGVAVIYIDADPLGKESLTDRSAWLAEAREWCLKEQPGRKPDPRTMGEFWSQHPHILRHIRDAAVDAEAAMFDFVKWYSELTRKYDVVHWVADPAAYDFQWVNSLYHQHAPLGAPAFPYTAKCVSSIKTAYRLLGLKLQDTEPQTLKHTHNALDDALEQAYTYLRILRELERFQKIIAPTIEGVARLRASAVAMNDALKLMGFKMLEYPDPPTGKN